MTDLSQTFLGCLVSIKVPWESSLCSTSFSRVKGEIFRLLVRVPLAHSMTTNQMLMLTEINMNVLYSHKFLEALISVILWYNSTCTLIGC